ncbi:methylenetetrahydrofolate reductase C-terminal domain-containing protein [Mycobacterium deserti]|uniref:Methylenetetrahydrofolate reductase C-terminal domain-containing protein n=1 Tax=Mycobacterium deserti TaxID=2978347 RepID=A0ABT2MGL5_9MYCO|nr:methylenetetrahydrofolate reductase C-terminal domain-containing protein [Mycobacterium deserti]MCT7660669.1 methylenetetrahydrofolate reductase C-terminal domain-containing protein [Mycobacterium deserti]
MLVENRFYRWLARALERRDNAYRVFTLVEKKSKERLFGCQMCGQCELPTTGYACPMTCPKQLRNGPCGGVSADGRCEVHPDVRCVWVLAYERAVATGHSADFSLLQRPVDHREQGRSSWINYWQGRDDEMAADPSANPRMVKRDGTVAAR